MPTTSSILASFRSRGLTIVAVDGRLKITPPGAMTDVDRAALREHKAALLALLAPGGPGGLPAIGTDQGAPKECFSHEQEPPPCRRCGGGDWRLRETPQSGGGWLWICATCADRFGDTKIPPYIPAPVEDGDLIDEARAPTSPAAVLVSGDDADYIEGPAAPAPLIESCIWCGTWTPLGVCCAACKQPSLRHRTSRTLVEELPYSDHAATA